MDFAFSPEQEQIREQVGKLCAGFDESYWLERDRSAKFPEEFYTAMAEGGWLGIAMPEAYGGSGLGITEAALMMQAVAESGAAMTGASAVHMNIFGLNPVVVFGTDEQKRRMLPPLIEGREKACFAVTEPDAGLNTTEISTRAERRGEDYLVSGRKIWISTAQVAHKVLLLARTTPLDRVQRKTEGLSLFYTDLDRSRAEIREIPKMGRHAVDSNLIFMDQMPVRGHDRIGAEGDGFRTILHGLNPERILVAAEAVGIGRAIGQNQGIQHPLAKAWAALEAADLMTFKAASLYDAGKDCGVEANAAKYLAGEAAFTACEQSVLTLGGMGYAEEYHLERYWRESWIPRIAPVTPHLILNYIAERALGLPKSY